MSGEVRVSGNLSEYGNMSKKRVNISERGICHSWTHRKEVSVRCICWQHLSKDSPRKWKLAILPGIFPFLMAEIFLRFR